MAREWVTAVELGRWSNEDWGAGSIYLQYDKNSVSLTDIVARIKIDIDTPGVKYDSDMFHKCNVYVLINHQKDSNYQKGTQICRKAYFMTSDENSEVFNLHKTDFPSGYSDIKAFGKKFYFPASILHIPEPGVYFKTPDDFLNGYTWPFTILSHEDYSIYPEKTVARPLDADTVKANIYLTDQGKNNFLISGGMGSNEYCVNNEITGAYVTLEFTEPIDTSTNKVKINFNYFVTSIGSSTLYSSSGDKYIYKLTPTPGTINVTFTMIDSYLANYRNSWFTVRASLELVDKYGIHYPNERVISKAIYIHKAPDPVPELPYLDMASLSHKSRLTLKENFWTFKWTLPTDYNSSADRYITANGGRLVGLRARLLRIRGGKIFTVPIVDPDKVANGKTGTSAYHAGVVVNSADIGTVNNTDGSKSYVYRNDCIYLPATSTSINISPVSVDNLTGFEVGDKISFQISTHSRYGINFDDTVEEKLVSNVKSASWTAVQNAAVVRAREDDTWKEGIVQVYQDDKWIEAEAVYVYTADGEWVEST